MKDANFSSYQRRSVFATAYASAAGLDTNQSDVFIINKTRKNTYCVTPTPHTSHNHIREPAELLQRLFSGFSTDTTLKMLYYRGVRMRSTCRTEKIKRISYVSCPVAKGVIDGIFERSCSAFDWYDFGTAEFHFVHIDALPLNISHSHKDFGFHAKQCTNHCRSQTVLTSAGFSNKFRFAHIFG